MFRITTCESSSINTCFIDIERKHFTVNVIRPDRRYIYINMLMFLDIIIIIIYTNVFS